MIKYKDELTKSMKWLGQKEDTIFLGQATKYSGHAISDTLKEVPKDKLIELPVMEEVQMGMCAGLSLEGYIPISIYPRFNFMMLAINQLINHLDKMEEMTKGNLISKVIIRVAVGSKKPLDAGLQHTQNYTEALKKMITNIKLVELHNAKDIKQAFETAYLRNGSTIIVEWGDYYSDK